MRDDIHNLDRTHSIQTPAHGAPGANSVCISRHRCTAGREAEQVLGPWLSDTPMAETSRQAQKPLDYRPHGKSCQDIRRPVRE